MSSLITFVKKASKPSQAVESVMNFIEEIGEMEENISLIDNDSEEFKILLKRQGFDPDVKLTKINDVIASFGSISKNSIDLFTLNTRIEKNYGIRFVGIDNSRNDGTIVIFKKMTNCII